MVFAIASGTAFAKPVTPLAAKTVAQNFYKQNSATPINSITLAYTYTDAAGLPVYYAYNINSSDGFVIISAEDAGRPIIGYSTKNSFTAPEVGHQANYWLGLRVKEVQSMRERNVVADAKAAAEWNKYATASSARLANGGNASVAMTTTVAPLVQTTWNQSPYYNALCPGGSVTGCVATTMSQIMRYWKWPARGTGSSSYTQNPNPNNYPMQSANYGATTYNWNNMPLSVTSSNIDVATINYQTGVSVNMNYAPTGSGAQVLQYAPGSPCAQNSYITYFSYDPNTIAGYYRDNVGDDTLWMSYIKNDLDIGRPVQYVGTDPSEGGHTWVCDGYDVNNYVHMNWGWAGSDDGFFSINNLQTTNGGFNPSQGHQILTGIVPLAVAPLDASVASISSPSGAYCPSNNNLTPSITLLNAGSTTMTSCNINYKIDGGAVQTINWTGNLVDHQSTVLTLPSYVSTAGTHTLTCYSSSPNGSADGNPANDTSYTTYSIGSLGVLPVIEGFENPSTYSSWSMSNSGGAPNWAVTTTAAADGTHSIMLNNLGNTSGNVSLFQTVSSYNLSTLNSPALTFKAAYQETSTSNNDGLQVFTSTDCGSTWTSRRYLSSGQLCALAGGTGSSPYVPAPTQFTTYTIAIGAVSSGSQVSFKWVFTAGSSVGNNIFIDDINIFDAAPLGIATIENAMGLNLYPNPSSGAVNIAFTLSSKENISVNVVDMLGRVVESIPTQQYAAGNNTLTIGQQTYQAGIYFVNINVNGQLISKKIVMQ